MFEIATPLAGYSDIVLLLVRLIAGAIMLYYGIPKVKDLKANASDFVGMGFKPGWLWGTIIALLELLGGIGIILGILVAPIALLFGFEMLLGAVWKILKTDKKFSDWSYDLLLFTLMLVLLVFGAGSVALF